MQLGWYIGRLRNMGPGEIAHRLAERTKQWFSRHRHEGWTRFTTPGPAISPLPGLREAVLEASPAQRAEIAAAAQAILDGRFAALGVSWPTRERPEVFPPELWRRDPVSGGLWPGAETYCFDIDFRRQGELGDIKYVWEINRLQLLQPLALHALLSGDRRTIAAIETVIASWHYANPPFRGTGWASGIEVALLSISLLVATSLCGERFSPQTTARVAQILTASAFWLPRFPSRFSSANNHLVAELAGEFLLAGALGRDAARARVALLEEIQKQILPDGAGAEQTPTYAAFTVELALLGALVARAGGVPFPETFDLRIAAFATFVTWLAGTETTPKFGDDDEGRVLTLCQAEPDYAASIATAIAGHLRRAAAAPATFRNLFFGPPVGASPVPQGVTSFPDGGISVWRGARNGHALSLVFDHGPLGYLSIAAHGHADALSLTLGIDGLPVLVDPGTFLYGSGGAWRSWFRGTAAHNTLNLGADQSTMAGPFNWSHKAPAQLDEQIAGDDWRLTASHNGYAARFGVRHQRSVIARSDGIAIVDRLLGPPQREAEIVFQLAPDLTATVDGVTVTIARGATPILRLDLPNSAIATASGGDTPAGGWVSPRFGERFAATRIAWRGVVSAAGVTTLLRL